MINPSVFKSLHLWHDVSHGEELEKAIVDAIIEIPMGSSNKYELDKKTSLLRLDRVLHSAVYYPANYGFIPQTLADDGDPLDILVLGSEPLYPLTLITTRIIGLIEMKDQNETDNKIIAVPVFDPEYKNCFNITDLTKHRIAVLRRFFEDYKILEEKSVIVEKIEDCKVAINLVIETVKNYFDWRKNWDNSDIEK